jgi:hypothetical protein
MKVTISFGSSLGKNSSFPACAACSSTTAGPPTIPEITIAMYTMPPMITVIWKRSVNATESMPPESVQTSTIATPRIMPCHG